jgi:uncharacterized protein YodC (DUF2158 family)
MKKMSEDEGFKIGDTVTLKSGGHLMTVASIDEGSVTCDWSVRNDVKSKSFPAAELQKADLPRAKPTIDVSRLTSEQRAQLRELLLQATPEPTVEGRERGTACP